MNMQALVDGMNAQWMKERAATQMTLGKMIERLQELPSDTRIDGIGDPHSYRGYYSDLAFEPMQEKTDAVALLAMCKESMGEVFTGYKGGDFVMGALTPVWVANYGCCGKKLINIAADGTLQTAEDD